MACFDNFITASANINCTATSTVSNATFTVPIWYNFGLSYDDLITTILDYRDLSNKLHVEEFRKDIFRHETISLFNRYYQKPTVRFIPASKNFKGTESRRL